MACIPRKRPSPSPEPKYSVLATGDVLGLYCSYTSRKEQENSATWLVTVDATRAPPSVFHEDVLQLRQMTSRIIALGRTFDFWCDVRGSKLFSQFYIHVRSFNHRGGVGSLYTPK